MTTVDRQTLQEMMGPQAVSGPIAGMGVHYNVGANASVSSSATAVTLELDEKSLKDAEAKTGVSRSPSPSPKKGTVPAKAIEHANKGEDRYASLVGKSGKQDTIIKAMSKNFGSRRLDHRTAMTSTASKNPLLRSLNRRRLLELRKTFNQIASAKTKTAIVNAENMPQMALKKMVDRALSQGLNKTPIGEIADAMKKVGYDPSESLQKGLAQQALDNDLNTTLKKGAGANLKPETQKKRQWALFMNPELIPSGWAMD